MQTIGLIINVTQNWKYSSANINKYENLAVNTAASQQITRTERAKMIAGQLKHFKSESQ